MFRAVIIMKVSQCILLLCLIQAEAEMLKQQRENIDSNTELKFLEEELMKVAPIMNI